MVIARQAGGLGQALEFLRAFQDRAGLQLAHEAALDRLHPDDRMALIAACETANHAAAVQTVLIVLGEISLSKLLEVFH